jgi:rRNA maturation protein Rpf1
MKQTESWFSDNKMIINVNKSKAIFFHLKNKNTEENPHIVFKNKKMDIYLLSNF